LRRSVTQCFPGSDKEKRPTNSIAGLSCTPAPFWGAVKARQRTINDRTRRRSCSATRRSARCPRAFHS
jgi:hypothetical protein